MLFMCTRLLNSHESSHLSDSGSDTEAVLQTCFPAFLSASMVCLMWNTKHTKLQRCKNEC